MACCIKQVLNFDVVRIFAFLLQIFLNVLRYFPLSQDPDFLFFTLILKCYFLIWSFINLEQRWQRRRDYVFKLKMV